MELVDIEYRREGRGWVLRLYIDKEGGVTLEDCARVSQEVGASLDVEDFIMTPYVLEVSSPGLNRPLKKREDFLRFKDHLIRVKTFEAIDKQRQFKGKLVGLKENQIEVERGGSVIRIPLSNVARANLEIDWDQAWKPRGRKGTGRHPGFPGEKSL